jgi:hypothetical protein
VSHVRPRYVVEHRACGATERASCVHLRFHP